MNDNFYNYLQEKVYESVEHISLNEFNKRNTLLLGSNVLSKFEPILNQLRTMYLDFSCVFLGHENHLAYVKQIWGEHYKTILWTGAYSKKIIEKLKEESMLGNLDSFLFLSADVINLRDLNLMELALELEKFNIETFVYDYGLQELYRYKNVQIIKSGLQLYQQINEFIDMTM